MSRPWMPLYPSDYLADTAHLSAAESGAYLHLIMHYWTNRSLPTDDKRLARIARMSDAEWAEARPIIFAFFDAEWHHGRIDEELAEADEKYERRANAGREGGKTAAENRKRSSNATSNAEAMLYQPQPQSDIDKKEDKGAPSRAGYSKEFEDSFWKPYPRTPIMSKKEAWRVWQKASEDERPKIIAAVPRYAAWLRTKPDHPAVHACRFISQRRYDGFAEPEPPELVSVAGKYYAKPETPQLFAWDEHLKKVRGKGLPRDRGGGWWVDSEWPPQENAGAAA